MITPSGTSVPATATTAANSTPVASLDEPAATQLSEIILPTIKVGDRGTDVRTIQLLLRYRRHDIVDDGIFGSATENEVKVFQTKNNLESTGIVDAQTWERLFVSFGEGARGEPVKAVQLQLSQKHAAGVDADGDFGPKTKAAVMRFQEQMRIRVDGVVGPTTWRYLVAARGAP